MLTARRLAVLAGLVVAALALVLGRSSDQLDANRAAMVKVGKAAGLIDQRFPAECARAGFSATHPSWGALDQPSEPHDPHCGRFARKVVIVFHRIAGRWRIATTRPRVGRFGRCRVLGVPPAVVTSLPICP